MNMKFIALFLLLFTSVSACADHELTGLWEGYNLIGATYGSQILEIDENGKGFYAYSIGESMHEKLVFAIDLSNVKFENGHIEININQPSGHHTIIMAQDLGSKLNVLTIFTDLSLKPFFSIPWALTRVSENLRNKALYEFAKNYL